MISGIDRALGIRTVLDLGVQEEIEYIFSREFVGDAARHIGIASVVGTQYTKLANSYDMTVYNGPLFIGDEPTDKKDFYSAYRDYVGGIKESLGPEPEPDPDQPDIFEAAAAKAGQTLAKNNVITLGGFVVMETTGEDKKLQTPSLFCATPLAEELAFAMREDISGINMDELEKFKAEAKDDREKMFADLADSAIRRIKAVDPTAVSFMGLSYIAYHLPEPSEIKKKLGLSSPPPPPPRKHKKR